MYHTPILAAISKCNIWIHDPGQGPDCPQTILFYYNTETRAVGRLLADGVFQTPAQIMTQETIPYAKSTVCLINDPGKERTFPSLPEGEEDPQTYHGGGHFYLAKFKDSDMTPSYASKSIPHSKRGPPLHTTKYTQITTVRTGTVHGNINMAHNNTIRQEDSALHQPLNTSPSPTPFEIPPLPDTAIPEDSEGFTTVNKNRHKHRTQSPQAAGHHQMDLKKKRKQKRNTHTLDPSVLSFTIELPAAGDSKPNIGPIIKAVCTQLLTLETVQEILPSTASSSKLTPIQSMEHFPTSMDSFASFFQVTPQTQTKRLRVAMQVRASSTLTHIRGKTRAFLESHSLNLISHNPTPKPTQRALGFFVGMHPIYTYRARLVPHLRNLIADLRPLMAASVQDQLTASCLDNITAFVSDVTCHPPGEITGICCRAVCLSAPITAHSALRQVFQQTEILDQRPRLRLVPFNLRHEDIPTFARLVNHQRDFVTNTSVATLDNLPDDILHTPLSEDYGSRWTNVTGTLDAPDTQRSLAHHLLHSDDHLHAIEPTAHTDTYVVVTTTSFMHRVKGLCHKAIALLWEPDLVNKLGPVGTRIDEIDTQPSVRNYIPSAITDGTSGPASTTEMFSYLTILQHLPSPSAGPDPSETNSPTAHTAGYTFDLDEMEPPLESNPPPFTEPPATRTSVNDQATSLPLPSEDPLDNSVTETSTMSLIQSIASMHTFVSDLQKQQQEFQLQMQKQIQQMQDDQARRDKERADSEHQQRMEYTELIHSLASRTNMTTSSAMDAKTPPPRAHKRNRREQHAIEVGPSTLSLAQSSGTSVNTAATDPTTTTTQTGPSGDPETLEDHNMEPSPSPIPSPPRVQRQYTTEEMDAAAEVQAAHHSKTTPRHSGTCLPD